MFSYFKLSCARASPLFCSPCICRKARVVMGFLFGEIGTHSSSVVGRISRDPPTAPVPFNQHFLQQMRKPFLWSQWYDHKNNKVAITHKNKQLYQMLNTTILQLVARWRPKEAASARELQRGEQCLIGLINYCNISMHAVSRRRDINMKIPPQHQWRMLRLTTITTSHFSLAQRLLICFGLTLQGFILLTYFLTSLPCYLLVCGMFFYG